MDEKGTIKINTKDEVPEVVIAQKIIEAHLIYTIEEWDAKYDSSSIAIYKEGVFIVGKRAGSQIREWITDVAENVQIETINSDGKTTYRPYRITMTNRAEILEQIKTRTFCSFTEFDIDMSRLSCRNGHVCFKPDGSHVFIEHFEHNENPYKTFFQIPWDYNPDAECLKIDQALTDIFGLDRVPLIYEILAYCCMPFIKYEKAFLLYGPPNSGKTTFIEGLLMALLGGSDERNWIDIASQTELQALGFRFALSRLKGKRINYFDDLSPKALRATAMKYFRILVTNKFLAGELKHVNGQVGWRNIIKLIFTCNDLPELKKDPGEQFWRRWLLLHCNNEFKEADKFIIEDRNDPNLFEKDTGLKDKLINGEQMSGLVNKIIEAWKRLEERGSFPAEWDDSEAIKKLWLFDVNPIASFVEECCETKPEYEVDYEIFYKALNKYREKNNAKPISKHMMTQKMGLLGLEGWNDNKKIEKRYHRESSGRNYVGIRIKTEEEKEKPQNSENRTIEETLGNLPQQKKDNVDYSDIDRF